MRLPNGWDNKIRTLESKIKETKKELTDRTEEIDEEIRRVERRYERRIELLSERLDSACSVIRETYKIEHPLRKNITTSLEAAEVLAYYWQGEDIPQERLVRYIECCNFVGFDGDSRDFFGEAMRYANNLTAEGTPEREYVREAEVFLFKDVEDYE